MVNDSGAPARSSSMSDDIRELAKAFILAKKEFKKTGFSAENKHQGYRYAKIQDIYDAVEDGLLKNNIIIWHFRKVEGDVSYLATRLIHTLSGQWIEDCALMYSEKPGNQAIGAARTYMAKYAILSLCAIATEDDDCEDEEKYIEKSNATILPGQAQEISSMIREHPSAKDLWNKISSLYKIRAPGDIKKKDFESILKFIDDFSG